MKNYLMMLLVFCLMAVGAAAAEKVEPPKSCQQCGMDREHFAHSRMLVVYADGASVGLCSLNCVVVEMKKAGKREVKSLMVADYGTKKLTNARKATWVVGGSKSGVMTDMPKWAFAKKGDAEKFVKENGGRMTTFDEALDMAVKENQ